jgi:hypothetical protein
VHAPETRELALARKNGHTHVELPSLESRFPRSERWGFRGFCFPDATHQQIEVQITDCRHEYRKMLIARTAALTGDVDILVAFRIADSESERRERNGDFVIFEVQDNRLACLAESDVPLDAAPSLAALDEELLDDARLFGMGRSTPAAPSRPPYVRVESWAQYSLQRIEIGERCHDENFNDLGIEASSCISWNGAYSNDITFVSRPDYHGGASICTEMDKATIARTRGKLPEWPEPVWGVGARLVSAK